MFLNLLPDPTEVEYIKHCWQVIKDYFGSLIVGKNVDFSLKSKPVIELLPEKFQFFHELAFLQLHAIFLKIFMEEESINMKLIINFVMHFVVFYET